MGLGVALLRPKAALFADEPTTGLDAASALRVAALLRRCARRGFTVVAVLHQPRAEIVDALDAVLLLHRGRVAFAGPPKDVLERFRAPGGNAVDPLDTPPHPDRGAHAVGGRLHDAARPPRETPAHHHIRAHDHLATRTRGCDGRSI